MVRCEHEHTRCLHGICPSTLVRSGTLGVGLREREAMALYRSPLRLWYFFWVVSLIAAAPLQWAPAVTGQGELEKAWGNEVRVLEGDLLSALPLELSLPIQAGQGACLHVSRSLCTAPALGVRVMWQSPGHPRCLCPCQGVPVSGCVELCPCRAPSVARPAVPEVLQRPLLLRNVTL